MKIVRDSAVRQEPAQPQAVSPEENRFSIRPRQIALFFLWMLAFTLLARGTSGALLPEVQLSTPAPNTISYWGGLLPAVGKAIETGFSLNPCAKDVLAKWNTLGLLIAATLANAAAGKLMLSRQQKNSTNL